MSKSYGNTIDPFLPEKKLRKRVMSIKSDSTPMDRPKDADADATFQIFSALAGAESQRTADLRAKYENPPSDGFGYGHAKQALFELMLDIFGPAREKRAALMNDQNYIDQILKQGADAARAEATPVMERLRKACGLR